MSPLPTIESASKRIKLDQQEGEIAAQYGKLLEYVMRRFFCDYADYIFPADTEYLPILAKCKDGTILIVSMESKIKIAIKLQSSVGYVEVLDEVALGLERLFTENIKYIVRRDDLSSDLLR